MSRRTTRCVRSFLALNLLVAACGSPAVTDPPASPALRSSPTPTISIVDPSPRPSVGRPSIPPTRATAKPASSMAPRPTFEPGDNVWTVSDRVRVRSKPKVSPDSLTYEPLLRTGTALGIVDGPVAGSGYWWYKVRVYDVHPRGGIDMGWLAAGDHDGTPWIGYDGLENPDTDPVPEPEFPPLLDPIVIVEGTEDYIGSDGEPYTRYQMSITNWADYPPELFEPAPDLDPCGLNTDASRTWVSIFGPDGEYIYGFCGFSEPRDLVGIWFAVPSGDPPPERVIVLIWDRLTDREAYSDYVTP